MSKLADDVRAPASAAAPAPLAAPPAGSPAMQGRAPVPGQWSVSLQRWAWVPLVLLVAALLVLKGGNGSLSSVSMDSPGLRAALTFVFGTLVALIVASLVGRSFLVRGEPGLLLLGCGIAFLGLAGIAATLVGGKDVNLNVTIFNLCAWLAAVCHFLGAFLLLRPRRALPAPGLWLWLAGLLVGAAVGLVAVAARQGWTPLFFVQGQGGTPVRQVLLSSAITLFGLAALLPGAVSRQALSPFFQWYRLALGLTVVGFLGAMLQRAFGSLLGWTAWGAMCLSGVYMLVAALASLRESRAWGLTLETALHESEERFKVLTEASFEGIALTEEGRLIDGNEQFFQMLGYRREELLGRQISTLNAPENRERVLQIIGAGREASIESTMIQKEGARIAIEAHGKPLVYQGRPIRVTAFRDITARKQAERALQEAQAKLQAHAGELEQTVARRTAKLHEAIGELEHFSYAITHDMRAPLRAMQGYAEILDSQCAQCRHELSREFFRRIKIAASRMDQLITDSLNYSKAVRQEVALEPVRLQELLQGMIETYPNLLPDKADIRLEPGLPVVMGSPAALTQCFGNLLGNAVKFAHPGSKPRIRIWAELVDSGKLIEDRAMAKAVESGKLIVDGATASLQPPSDSQPSTLNPQLVRVVIEDNGIGIPKDMQERIFGLFERASNEQEGTGLGLAIVRKLARRMGGEVGVESEPGKGSRFWVELERAPTAVVK